MRHELRQYVFLRLNVVCLGKMWFFSFGIKMTFWKSLIGQWGLSEQFAVKGKKWDTWLRFISEIHNLTFKWRGKMLGAKCVFGFFYRLNTMNFYHSFPYALSIYLGLQIRAGLHKWTEPLFDCIYYLSHHVGSATEWQELVTSRQSSETGWRRYSPDFLNKLPQPATSKCDYYFLSVVWIIRGKTKIWVSFLSSLPFLLTLSPMN